MSDRAASEGVAALPPRRARSLDSLWSQPFMRPAPLAFAVAMFAEVVYEVRGGDELGVILNYHLHAEDLAAAAIMFAILAARPRIVRLGALQIFTLLLGVVVAYTLTRGASASAFHAFYVFRDRAVALLFLFYVAFSGKKIERISNFEPWLILYVWIYFFLFLLRSQFGPRLFLAGDSTAYQTILSLELRLVSTQTVIYLGGVLLLFVDLLFRKRITENRNVYLWTAAIAFIEIVLSRQRTATSAAFIGLAVWYLANQRLVRRHRVLYYAAVGFGLLAATIWAAGLLPDLIGMLPRVFQVSIQKTQTLDAREDVWAVALGWRYANWDIVRKIFGPPSGEALDLVLPGGVFWPYSLHSQYVATIMTYGLSGVLCWLGIMGTAIVGLFRNLKNGLPNRAGLPAGVAIAWLVAMLVFGFAYEWQGSIGFFVALAVAGWAKGYPKAAIANRPANRRRIADRSADALERRAGPDASPLSRAWEPSLD